MALAVAPSPGSGTAGPGTVTIRYVPAVPGDVAAVPSLNIYAILDLARTGTPLQSLGPGIQDTDGSWLFTGVTMQPDGTYPLRFTVTPTVGSAYDDLNDFVTFPIPERRGDAEPLEPWVTAAQIVADAPEVTLANAELAAQAATDILYALSGRRYDGLRVSVLDAPFVPGPGRQALPYGLSSLGIGQSRRGFPTPLNEISAGVFPVTDVRSVTIGSHDVDPTLVKIVDRQKLRLLPDPVLGSLLGVNLYSDGSDIYSLWPGGECGCGCGPARATITVEWGQQPPAGGVIAARAFAKELALGISGKPCRLPGNTVNISRQNVTVLLDPSTYLDQGLTGIPTADLWLRAVNPNRLQQESTIWSPDLPMSERVR